MSGLIGDRQYTLSLTVASGRNFIAVSAVACGGLGVAIDPLLNLCALMRLQRRAQMRIFESLGSDCLRYYSRKSQKSVVSNQ